MGAGIGVIYGIVTDVESGEPLHTFSATLLGTGTCVNAYVGPYHDGGYYTESLPGSGFTLVFQAEGYLSNYAIVDVGPDQFIEQDMALERMPPYEPPERRIARTEAKLSGEARQRFLLLKEKFLSSSSAPARRVPPPPDPSRLSPAEPAATSVRRLSPGISPVRESMKHLSNMTGSSNSQRGTYQMDGDFVLNTYTGDVWRVDEKKAAFSLVEKEEPMLTLIERSVMLIDLAAVLEAENQKMEEAMEHLIDSAKSGAKQQKEAVQYMLDMIRKTNERQKKNIESAMQR